LLCPSRISVQLRILSSLGALWEESWSLWSWLLF
jgi:hypothetical protein